MSSSEKVTNEIFVRLSQGRVNVIHTDDAISTFRKCKIILLLWGKVLTVEIPRLYGSLPNTVIPNTTFIYCMRSYLVAIKNNLNKNIDGKIFC
jgi:hypothetical protein